MYIYNYDAGNHNFDEKYVKVSSRMEKIKVHVY